jgi:hypothetical protein
MLSSLCSNQSKRLKSVLSDVTPYLLIPTLERSKSWFLTDCTILYHQSMRVNLINLFIKDFKHSRTIV